MLPYVKLVTHLKDYRLKVWMLDDIIGCSVTEATIATFA